MPTKKKLPENSAIKAMSIRVLEKQFKKLALIAHNMGDLSNSDVVRIAIKQYLEREEKKNPLEPGKL